MEGCSRSTTPVRPKSAPSCPSTADASTSAPTPRARTRNVRPWKSKSRANERIESKSPEATSSQTTCARPSRCTARSTGPVASSRSTCESNTAARISTRSAASAARASARGRVGCSPDNSMKIRTPVERRRTG